MRLAIPAIVEVNSTAAVLRMSVIIDVIDRVYVEEFLHFILD